MCIFSILLVYVTVFSPPQYIFHTLMARCSLIVLKVSLNSNKPTLLSQCLLAEINCLRFRRTPTQETELPTADVTLVFQCHHHHHRHHHLRVPTEQIMTHTVKLDRPIMARDSKARYGPTAGLCEFYKKQLNVSNSRPTLVLLTSTVVLGLRGLFYALTAERSRTLQSDFLLQEGSA